MTDRAMEVAVRAALDLWDGTYGGGPIDFDQDGFTCDEIGSLAAKHHVDGRMLLDAVVTARNEFECAVCGDPAMRLVSGVTHHIDDDDPELVWHDRDAEHVPYEAEPEPDIPDYPPWMEPYL